MMTTGNQVFIYVSSLVWMDVVSLPGMYEIDVNLVRTAAAAAAAVRGILHTQTIRPTFVQRAESHGWTNAARLKRQSRRPFPIQTITAYHTHCACCCCCTYKILLSTVAYVRLCSWIFQRLRSLLHTTAVVLVATTQTQTHDIMLA